MTEQLLETWDIHNRINLYLLDAVKEDHLAAVASSKGRSVGAAFAHMHTVRLMWLAAADASLLKGQAKFESDARHSKKHLAAALTKSSKAVAALLERGFKEGKVRGFKPHPSAFLGYLLSHESHHRGQIMLALKQSGHPVDKKIQYGLWEWGSR